MGFEDIALILLVIGIAAAGAIKLCPTPAALLFVVHIRPGKAGFLFQIVVPSQHIAHLPLGLADKLMTREYLSFRIHGTVFIPAAAAAQTFNCTGTLIQIQHKVEKVEPLPLQLALQYNLGQPVILRKYSGKILFTRE